MNPKSNILCVFEGETRETKYFKTLEGLYFSDSSILVCCFGNDIYELYEELRDDEDLDIVEVLRESKDVPKNAQVLDEYNRDDFNQVFLFFDVECQDDKFSPDRFLDVVGIFDEETERGKLFISYPMIEAIRDIPDYSTYIDHKVEVKNCSGKVYKPLSAQGIQDFNDPRHKDQNNWNKLVKINVEKGNYICTGQKFDYSIPEQLDIAKSQMQSLSDTESLFVLSSYPLFIFHQKSSRFTFD
ncbi:hypothetical protein [Shewanella algae]|uniref:hypothetical protein n=1 Tax=Shewanella algae TaxID=38313 RepID=UPI0031F48A2A